MLFAIIDIEASGGSPKRDRVVDIAVFLHDGTQVVDSFSTLINPGVRISPFITKLTGISNEMVADAPTFAEVAEKINAITQDAVFVAHNVQFDYLYVRNEYKRLGINYMRPKLCTIDLARRVMPGHTSYGLDTLTTDLQIPVTNRHRAEGDARATVHLFDLLLLRDAEQAQINALLQQTNKQPNLPQHIPLESIEALPEEAGIFYFYDNTGKVIYIGKSADIRRRVFQHFIETTEVNKLYRMVRRISNVSFQETGSELLAALLEIAEIRRLKPTYNRSQLAKIYRYGIFKTINEQGYIQLELRRKQRHEPVAPIAHYERELHAQLSLAERIEKNQLCPCLCGTQNLPKGDAVCSNVQEKQCKGAAMGLEKSTEYNKRVEKALKDMQMPYPNFLLLDEGRSYNEKSVIGVKNGFLYGYGFIDQSTQLSAAEICESLQKIPPHPETIKLLLNWFKKHPNEKLIKF